MKDFFFGAKNGIKYTGREINRIDKTINSKTVRFALAFPETYELGMSSLGYKILYEVGNQVEDCYCERAICPDPDFEAILRNSQEELFSLETRTPLKNFHMIGFSVMYEMNFTNILTILDLARIPLRSEDRDDSHPIIIAGGASIANPEPISDFIDLFCIGDGEILLPELLNKLKELLPIRDRHSSLKNLSEIKGVYAPLFHQIKSTINNVIRDQARPPIQKAILPDINSVFSNHYPLIPLVNTVHDRHTIEIQRGCLNGCRFCFAGYYYRPLREKNIPKIYDEIFHGICNSGFNEISLLSLNTGCFNNLTTLVHNLMPFLREKRISISLPSLKINSIPVETMKNIASIRKTGFTLAIEAGSDRLRKAINKQITEDQILKDVALIFESGWQLMKLYFMVGLPGETDEDLEEMITLIKKISRLAQKISFKNRINVSISQFVPKPFTPFQWAPYKGHEEVLEKLRHIKAALSEKNLNVRYGETKLNMLEAIFSRGDQRLGKVIHTAFRDFKCKMDGWTEHFNFFGWLDSFHKEGVDPADYQKDFSLTEPLSWNHIEIGVTNSHLVDEYHKSVDSEEREMCTTSGCHNCGACDEHGNFLNNGAVPEFPFNFSPAPTTAVEKQLRCRIKFNKLRDFRYLSNLNLQEFLRRALQKSGVKLCYTEGFNPKIKIAFSPPEMFGVESTCEYIDLYLKIARDFIKEELIQKLNKYLPPELQVSELMVINQNADSIQTATLGKSYRLTFNTPTEKSGFLNTLTDSRVEYKDETELSMLLNIDINSGASLRKIMDKHGPAETLFERIAITKVDTLLKEEALS